MDKIKDDKRENTLTLYEGHQPNGQVYYLLEGTLDELEQVHKALCDVVARPPNTDDSRWFEITESDREKRHLLISLKAKPSCPKCGYHHSLETHNEIREG